MAKNKNYPLYEVERFTDFKDMLCRADEEAGDKLAIRYYTNYAEKQTRPNHKRLIPIKQDKEAHKGTTSTTYHFPYVSP